MKIRTLTLACAALGLLQACAPPAEPAATEAPTAIPLAQQTAGGVGFVVAGSPGDAAAETPPPRDENGRAVLGSVPGHVGSWEGFGSWPMLRLLDQVPEGNIMFFTPVDQARNDPSNFPKPLQSEIPYQPWAKALFEARARTRFEPYVRCKASPGAS